MRVAWGRTALVSFLLASLCDAATVKVLATGKPLAGAMVVVDCGPSASGAAVRPAPAVTDASGQVNVEIALAKGCTLWVGHRAWGFVTQPWAGAATVELTRPAAVMSFEVLPAQKEEDPNATFRVALLWRSDAEPELRQLPSTLVHLERAAANGIAIGGLAAGLYDLEIRTAASAPRKLVRIPLEIGERRLLSAIRLVAADRICGTVIGLAPRSEASVRWELVATGRTGHERVSARGEFCIADLPIDELVELSAVIGLRETYAVRAAAPANGLELLAPEPRLFRARVVAADGEPLPEVLVAVGLHHGDTFLPLSTARWPTPEEGNAIEIPSETPCAIAISAAGYSEELVEVAADVALEEREIQMSRGAVLVGAVSTRTGEAVPGVRVAVACSSARLGKGSSASTDADGRYKIGGLTSGVCTVSAQGRGLGGQDKRVSLSTDVATTLDFVLDTERVLAGRVLDAASRVPIAGARVRLPAAAGPPSEQVTGRDGGFVFGGLNAGHTIVDVRSEGYRPVLEEILISSEDEPAPTIFLLTRGTRWRGRVLGLAGDGSGALVAVDLQTTEPVAISGWSLARTATCYSTSANAEVASSVVAH